MAQQRATVENSVSPAKEGDMRERIVDAARRLFSARGYRGTATKAIAVEAGVATGSVFYHFSSKEDVLRAVLTERIFSPQIPRVLASRGEDVRSTLCAIAESWVGGLADRTEMLTILVNARLETPDAFLLAQQELLTGLDILADYLVGQLGVDQTRAWNAAHGLLSSVLVGAVVVPSATIESGRDWIGDAVDLVLQGVEPR